MFELDEHEGTVIYGTGLEPKKGVASERKGSLGDTEPPVTGAPHEECCPKESGLQARTGSSWRTHLVAYSHKESYRSRSRHLVAELLSRGWLFVKCARDKFGVPQRKHTDRDLQSWLRPS